MKRDGVRLVGWVCVWLGVGFCVFTIAMLPVRMHRYEADMDGWQNALRLRYMGSTFPIGPQPLHPMNVTIAGVLVGLVPLGFGTVLLAIRRPARRQEGTEPPKRAPASPPPPEPAFPKATPGVRPPWERSP